MTVPKKAIIPALRRPTGLQSIDVSAEVDYAVVSRFTGDQHFFIKSLVEKGNNISTYVKKWRNYLESRKTNLTVSRRFDLSAPNTVALAFYSDEKTAPCKMLWAIQGLKNADMKILALWFNSTINLSQILLRRAETRGAFMGLDQYILQQFLVLDTTALTEQQKNKLVKVFDKNAKTKLPSIIEQLRTKNAVRKAIDLALLQTLEIKGNHEEMLYSAYESVAESITTLATIMKEGKIED